MRKRTKHTLLKMLGLFSSMRGYNILMVCIAQYLASIFILSNETIREVILDENLFMLVLSGALAIAGGYIINGFYDKEKDLINKPLKSMIDRLVGQNTKLTLYFLLNILSVIVASYVSFRAVLFFSGYIFGMWFYSHRLKKMPFWGNFTSAGLSIVPFFAVFVYYKNFEKVIFIHALLLFLLILIKDFIK
ncbi:MAG: UbiA family prenyltransferase, partial [Capnocytophaga sp.]|nr:UbiA family prenyltransferase [Capnocytophaga sp.]